MKTEHLGDSFSPAGGDVPHDWLRHASVTESVRSCESGAKNNKCSRRTSYFVSDPHEVGCRKSSLPHLRHSLRRTRLTSLRWRAFPPHLLADTLSSILLAWEENAASLTSKLLVAMPVELPSCRRLKRGAPASALVLEKFDLMVAVYQSKSCSFQMDGSDTVKTCPQSLSAAPRNMHSKKKLKKCFAILTPAGWTVSLRAGPCRGTFQRFKILLTLFLRRHCQISIRRLVSLSKL